MKAMSYEDLSAKMVERWRINHCWLGAMVPPASTPMIATPLREGAA